MTKIFLDTLNGVDEFGINEFIYLEYNSAAKNIIICIKDEPSRLLPATNGNLQFLLKMTSYFSRKIEASIKHTDSEVLNLRSNEASIGVFYDREDGPGFTHSCSVCSQELSLSMISQQATSY